MSIENRGFSEENPKNKGESGSEKEPVRLLEEALEKVTEAKRKINKLQESGANVLILWKEVEKLEGKFAHKLMEIPKSQEEIDAQRELYIKIKDKYEEINRTLDTAYDALRKNKKAELEKEIREAKKHLMAVFEFLYLPPINPERN